MAVSAWQSIENDRVRMSVQLQTLEELFKALDGKLVDFKADLHALSTRMNSLEKVVMVAKSKEIE